MCAGALIQVSDHREGWGHVSISWGGGRAGYQQHIMRVIGINYGCYLLENHQKAASRRITHLLRERNKKNTCKWNGEDETVHQRCVQSFGRVPVWPLPLPHPSLWVFLWNVPPSVKILPNFNGPTHKLWPIPVSCFKHAPFPVLWHLVFTYPIYLFYCTHSSLVWLM